MNRDEIKKTVTSKYKEGQQVTIRIEVEGRKNNNSTKAKIIKFNPDTVLTEHNGYKESFTYWDFLRMTAPKKIKQSELYIPDKVRHRKTA